MRGDLDRARAQTEERIEARTKEVEQRERAVEEQTAAVMAKVGACQHLILLSFFLSLHSVYVSTRLAQIFRSRHIVSSLVLPVSFFPSHPPSPQDGEMRGLEVSMSRHRQDLDRREKALHKEAAALEAKGKELDERDKLVRIYVEFHLISCNPYCSREWPLSTIL
jgi:hypothetical protein